MIFPDGPHRFHLAGDAESSSESRPIVKSKKNVRAQAQQSIELGFLFMSLIPRKYAKAMTYLLLLLDSCFAARLLGTQTLPGEESEEGACTAISIMGIRPGSPLLQRRRRSGVLLVFRHRDVVFYQWDTEMLLVFIDFTSSCTDTQDLLPEARG